MRHSFNSTICCCVLHQFTSSLFFCPSTTKIREILHTQFGWQEFRIILKPFICLNTGANAVECTCNLFAMHRIEVTCGWFRKRDAKMKWMWCKHFCNKIKIRTKQNKTEWKQVLLFEFDCGWNRNFWIFLLYFIQFALPNFNEWVKLNVFYSHDTLLLTTQFRSRLCYITTLLSNNYYNEKQKQNSYANPDPDPIDRHAIHALHFEFAHIAKKNGAEKNATEIMLLSKCVPNIYGVALKRFHVKIVFDVHFSLCCCFVGLSLSVA